MSIIAELEATIKAIAVAGKGILAADESTGTITKRFASINVESTEENRRRYRELLFTTPDLEHYINGVILYEETLTQKTTEGKPFAVLLNEREILPGIKVDKGLVPLPNLHEESVTQGLDGLPERLSAYKKQGARFAKWRAVYAVTDTCPSTQAIKTNAELLARYAALCQAQGIVPIVEPEVLMDGHHTLERCQIVTEAVLSTVFRALERHHVTLEHIILKPSMIVAGKETQPQPNIAAAAKATITVLRRKVPAAVPTINFLSGGQSDEIATAHLNAINQQGHQPWLLSYSYGRALQAPALKIWQGKAENVAAAQRALLKRARLNSAASVGHYETQLEATT